MWLVDCYAQSLDLDPRARRLLAALPGWGIRSVTDAAYVSTFRLDSGASRTRIEAFARRVLADPVAEVFFVRESLDAESLKAHPRRDRPFTTVISVRRKPGVMDPVEDSLMTAARECELPLAGARTSYRVLLAGALSQDQKRLIARRLLANEVIEEIAFDVPFSQMDGAQGDAGASTSADDAAFSPVSVALCDKGDPELLEVSRKGRLALDVHEMRAIRAHFRDLGRDPTDVELETIAQTWSEHCVHKTLTGPVDFHELPEGADGTRVPEGGRPRRIDNLLKSFIARATTEANRDFCLSVFKDNAGVIAFDEDWGLCVKVETHNHPSAIEPYGGAGTGIGGVIRDILGTGLGAKPVMNLDVFCFGPPDTSADTLPKGALPPSRVFEGVVAGVRDYGNRMGIPTAAGALCFDERYVGNPLVYCGTVGLLPRGLEQKAPRRGDRVICLGGRTGRDGIGGATFSSAPLSQESETVSAHAVQIGNAITQKKLLDVLLQARDERLFTAVTDCGAGGLSSACGEMGATLGVEVDLSRVPLKYAGLSYREVWLSEAQERMVCAVPPDQAARFLALCAAEEVEATDLGAFTGDGRLRLSWRGVTVGDLDMHFLHEGLPRTPRAAVWAPPVATQRRRAPPGDGRHDDVLMKILASPNVACKERVFRQYDHEVQGLTVGKPFAGEGQGPSDGAILAPRLPGAPLSGASGEPARRFRGFAVGLGINPRYGDLDPRAMAHAVIDEALCNAVALGADPDQVAILDNFSWGDARKPDRLGSLVECCRGCHEAAVRYRLPFISGKDSLNNEYETDQGAIAIPPTLLITAVGVVPDIRVAPGSDFKRSGSAIVLLGATLEELGGSHFLLVTGGQGGRVPRLHHDFSLDRFRALHEAMRDGDILACHDLSEGGLAVALAEMAIGGRRGAELSLAKVPRGDAIADDATLLFSETRSRFVIETPAERAQALVERFRRRGAQAAIIGVVTEAPRLTMCGLTGAVAIDLPIVDLDAAWRALFASM